MLFYSLACLYACAHEPADAWLLAPCSWLLACAWVPSQGLYPLFIYPPWGPLPPVYLLALGATAPCLFTLLGGHFPPVYLPSLGAITPCLFTLLGGHCPCLFTLLGGHYPLFIYPPWARLSAKRNLAGSVVLWGSGAAWWGWQWLRAGGQSRVGGDW